jgi:hypothetical protein
MKTEFNSEFCLLNSEDLVETLARCKAQTVASGFFRSRFISLV